MSFVKVGAFASAAAAEASRVAQRAAADDL